MSSEGASATDEAMTKMLSDLLVDNAQLRMRLNSVIRNAVNTSSAAQDAEQQSFLLEKHYYYGAIHAVEKLRQSVEIWYARLSHLISV